MYSRSGTYRIEGSLVLLSRIENPRPCCVHAEGQADVHNLVRQLLGLCSYITILRHALLTSSSHRIGYKYRLLPTSSYLPPQYCYSHMFQET